MQTVMLTVPVKTKAYVSPEDVANIVQRLIDIGLADAAATLEDSGNSGEGDVAAAQLAVELDIGPPVVPQEPRVLVIVRGGVAEVISDVGVDVEVFDWDNRDGSAAVRFPAGVPSHFADLAEPLGVPVERAAYDGWVLTHGSGVTVHKVLNLGFELKNHRLYPDDFLTIRQRLAQAGYIATDHSMPGTTSLKGLPARVVFIEKSK